MGRNAWTERVGFLFLALCLTAVIPARADTAAEGCREAYGDVENTILSCNVYIAKPTTRPVDRLRAYQIRGKAHLAAGHIEDALVDFTHAIDDMPDGRLKGYVRFLRGTVWFDHTPRTPENLQRALIDLEAADLEAPGVPRILETLARAYVRAGNNDRAVRAGTLALEGDPKSMIARRMRAMALERRGDIEEARWDVDALVRRLPRDAELKAWRGRLHEKLGAWPRALYDYRAAAKIETTDELLAAIERMERRVKGR